MLAAPMTLCAAGSNEVLARLVDSVENACGVLLDGSAWYTPFSFTWMDGGRERGSEGLRERGSEGAREQERERGSEGARERGSEGASGGMKGG